MSIASINIQTAKSNSKAHLSRDKNHKITYLLDPDSKENEYKTFFDSEKYLAAAQVAAKKLTGRKMQQKAIEHFVQEAVLNLEVFHHVEDVEKVFLELKKEFGGFEIFDIAIHRDEGYFYNLNEELEYRPNRDIFFNDQDRNFYLDSKFTKQADLNQFEKRYNHHAHVLFSKFDLSTGKNPRLQKSDMSKIQTITAKSLGMQRGELFSKAKRMSHWQLKKGLDLKRDEKKKAQKNSLAKQKDLKAEISKLRAELQEQGAIRKDYAKLEQTNKELKEKIKQKDLTEQELKKRVEELLSDFKSKDEEFVAKTAKNPSEGRITLITEGLKSIPKQREVDQLNNSINSTLSKSIDYLLEKNTKTVEQKSFLYTETKEELDLKSFISDLKQVEKEHLSNYKNLVNLFKRFKNFAGKVKSIVESTQKSFKKIFAEQAKNEKAPEHSNQKNKNDDNPKRGFRR